MAIQISDNLLVNASKPQDAKYGPWGSLALARTAIPWYYRHKGLTIGVLDTRSQIREYWWKAGTADGDLVPKFTTSDLVDDSEYGDANLNVGGHHHYFTLNGNQINIGGELVVTDTGRNKIPVALRRRNMRVSLHSLNGNLPVDYILKGRSVSIPAEAAHTTAKLIYEEVLEHYTYQYGNLLTSSQLSTYYVLRSGDPLEAGSTYCEVIYQNGGWVAATPAATLTYEQLEKDEPRILPEQYTGERTIRNLRPHPVHLNSPQSVSFAAVAAYTGWFLGTPDDNTNIWVRANDIRHFHPDEDYSESAGVLVTADYGGIRYLFQSLVPVVKTGSPAKNPAPLDVDGTFINTGIWISVGGGGGDGTPGRDGADGKSAYQIWLDEGNTGTEQDFLDSLQGDPGMDGNDGQGFTQRGAWQASTLYNAYDVLSYEGSTYVVHTGFTSTTSFSTTNLTLWAAKGSPGDKGDPGIQGEPGAETVTIGGTKHAIDPETKDINLNDKLYDILDVSATIRNLVAGATYVYGEMSGLVPEGSKPMMQFTTRTDKFVFERGYQGNLVWCRYPKR